METTKRERRNMAFELRNMLRDGCSYKEQFFDLLYERVIYEYSFDIFEDVADRLADLIDWPTCTVVEKVTEINQPENPDPLYRKLHTTELCCSNCGEVVWNNRASIWNFCPHCGAEVLKNDE